MNLQSPKYLNELINLVDICKRVIEYIFRKELLNKDLKKNYQEINSLYEINNETIKLKENIELKSMIKILSESSKDLLITQEFYRMKNAHSDYMNNIELFNDFLKHILSLRNEIAHNKIKKIKPEWMLWFINLCSILFNLIIKVYKNAINRVYLKFLKEVKTYVKNSIEKKKPNDNINENNLILRAFGKLNIDLEKDQKEKKMKI
jgi:hypothetical protein